MSGQKPQAIYDSPMVGFMILLGLIYILSLITWYYMHKEIRNAIRWVRYSEMLVVEPFLPQDYEVKVKINKTPDYKDVYQDLEKRRGLYEVRTVKFHEQIDKIPEYKWSKLGDQHLSLFNAMAMQPLKMPIVYLLAAGALWCLFSGPTSLYRRKLSLEDLIKTQSSNFPAISPFIAFNPQKQPPRPPGSPVPSELPHFAEALGPEEWIAYNSIPLPDGALDEDAVSEAFVAQLGSRWKGPNSLAPYKQVLLAAFCLKASRKRTEADEMLGALARCWSVEDGLNLSRNKKLLKNSQDVLKNKDLAGKTLTVCNQHAFETTVMLRALSFAREEGGVLASAQFVWLRAHDRVLWYPLNNMGRQSFHMEALGAMAHYKAEKMTRRPIPVPKVEAAVGTIKSYMASSRVRPIPQLDYSKSKKKGIKKAV